MPWTEANHEYMAWHLRAVEQSDQFQALVSLLQPALRTISHHSANKFSKTMGQEVLPFTKEINHVKYKRKQHTTLYPISHQNMIVLIKYTK